MISFRQWRVDGDQLNSLCVEYAWQPDENHAVCIYGHLHQDQEVPDSHCGCGFYSYRADDANFGEWGTKGVIVSGAIQTWGKTQIHAKGIRSQTAKVIALCGNPKISAQKLQELRVRYQVPVFSNHCEMTAYVRTQGSEAPPLRWNVAAC